MTAAMRNLKGHLGLIILWFILGIVTHNKTFFWWIIVFCGVTLLFQLDRLKTFLTVLGIMLLLHTVKILYPGMVPEF